ncbi:MAG: hypothetical protein K2X39_09055 [Silvanigrellaceae bacterium]|nr:hypothetical protein [Silvanigrellaceae bacterium]
MTVVLLDVDKTVVSLATRQYNTSLFNLLSFFNIKEVYFLTRMGVSKEPSLTEFMRTEAIAEMNNWGISVGNVYTPLDLEADQQPGFAWKYISAMEEAAIKVKKTEFFGALDIAEEERANVIRDRFKAFKSAYKDHEDKKSLIGLPGIDENNEQAMLDFLNAHDEAYKNLPEGTQIEKAEVRSQIDFDWEDVVFIDDSQRERTPYEAQHRQDLTLRPPHSKGFNVEDSESYSSCAFFIKQWVQKQKAFPMEINNQLALSKIASFLPFAEQDLSAGYRKEALDLFRITYSIGKYHNYYFGTTFTAQQSLKKLNFTQSDLELINEDVDIQILREYFLPGYLLTRLNEVNQELYEQVFLNSVTELENIVPVSSDFSIVASLSQFFFGATDPVAERAEAIRKLQSSLNFVLSRFADVPNIHARTINLLNEIRRKYVNSPLIQQSLRQMALPLYDSPTTIYTLVDHYIKNRTLTTGIMGATGVKIDGYDENAPAGVAELLTISSPEWQEEHPGDNQMQAIVQSAKSSKARNSFFRTPEVEVFYDDIASIKLPSNA